jgi:hypothetical protein
MTALVVAPATTSTLDSRLLSSPVRLAFGAAAVVAAVAAWSVAPAISFFAALGALLLLGLDHVGHQVEDEFSGIVAGIDFP